MPPGRSRTYPVLLALFFLSGASGLVYQVVWLRKLSLVFGTTTFAVSAVISSFMAGLGLGSYLSGRYLAHRGRALRLFGTLEIGVGLYALALPWLLSAVERSFTRAVGGLGISVYGESLLKLLLSFAVLLLPTSLMGATLPLLAEHTVERFGHLGTRVGRLYALNTLGAAAGCFLAGFAAIPLLGVMGTTWAAAALNFTVGAVAIGLGWRDVRAETAPETRPEGAAGAPLYPDETLRWAIVAFAVSGFAGLGLEVVWTRLITLVFTGTTYAFTTMLSVYLVGIAAGSLAFGRVADRSADPLRLFGMLEIGIGVSVLALAPLFPRATGWVSRLVPTLGGGWAGEAGAKFAVGAALLIVPTFLFGTTFPVVSRVAARSLAGLGATIGRLYAANVAGGIAGGVAAGFVLIPLIGTDQTLRTLCGALLMLGLILVAASPLTSSRGKGAAIALAAAGAVLAAATGSSDLSREIHRGWLKPGERVSFYTEGAEATVMVMESRSEKRILVNGSQATGTSRVGLSINRLQGVLPFLFERMPRKVVAICFGSGTTFGTVSEFPTRVDGVEIAPQVIQAAGRFRRENYDVLRNPRFHLHLDDGRNFLLKSRDRYDAITMEPMHPAKTGVVNFYTRDFYALCRAHLEPGGVLSQWVPLYNLQPSDVKMLYRSFAESFPHALVFLYGYDTFMVGSDRPLNLSASRFLGRMPSARLQQDLAFLALDTPAHMLGTFLMGHEAMGRFAGSAPSVSDDRPLVEFTGPKSLNAPDTVPVNLRALMPFAEPATRYLGTDPGAGDSRLREELDSLFANRDRLIRERM